MKQTPVEYCNFISPMYYRIWDYRNKNLFFCVNYIIQQFLLLLPLVIFYFAFFSCQKDEKCISCGEIHTSLEGCSDHPEHGPHCTDHPEHGSHCTDHPEHGPHCTDPNCSLGHSQDTQVNVIGKQVQSNKNKQEEAQLEKIKKTKGIIHHMFHHLIVFFIELQELLTIIILSYQDICISYNVAKRFDLICSNRKPENYYKNQIVAEYDKNDSINKNDHIVRIKLDSSSVDLSNHHFFQISGNNGVGKTYWFNKIARSINDKYSIVYRNIKSNERNILSDNRKYVLLIEKLKSLSINVGLTQFFTSKFIHSLMNIFKKILKEYGSSDSVLQHEKTFYNYLFQKRHFISTGKITFYNLIAILHKHGLLDKSNPNKKCSYKLLILDEVLYHLDGDNLKICLNIFQSINQTYKIKFFFTSHNTVLSNFFSNKNSLAKIAMKRSGSKSTINLIDDKI